MGPPLVPVRPQGAFSRGPSVCVVREVVTIGAMMDFQNATLATGRSSANQVLPELVGLHATSGIVPFFVRHAEQRKDRMPMPNSTR